MPRSQPPPDNERRFICGNQEYRSLSHCFFHVLRYRKASLLIRTRCTGPNHHLLQIQSIFSLNDKLLSNLKILKTT